MGTYKALSMRVVMFLWLDFSRRSTGLLWFLLSLSTPAGCERLIYVRASIRMGLSPRAPPFSISPGGFLYAFFVTPSPILEYLRRGQVLGFRPSSCRFRLVRASFGYRATNLRGLLTFPKKTGREREARWVGVSTLARKKREGPGAGLGLENKSKPLPT